MKTALVALMIASLISINAEGSEVGSATRLRKSDPAPFNGVLIDQYDFDYLTTTDRQYEVLNRDFTEMQLEMRSDKNWPAETYYLETFIGGLLLGIMAGIAVK